jgi:hypothetical protein
MTIFTSHHLALYEGNDFRLHQKIGTETKWRYSTPVIRKHNTALLIIL